MRSLKREFDRLVITCQMEHVALPTQAQIQKKREAIKNYEARKLTEVRFTLNYISDSEYLYRQMYPP